LLIVPRFYRRAAPLLRRSPEVTVARTDLRSALEDVRSLPFYPIVPIVPIAIALASLTLSALILARLVSIQHSLARTR
jgi:hypothetical protein